MLFIGCDSFEQGHSEVPTLLHCRDMAALAWRVNVLQRWSVRNHFHIWTNLQEQTTFQTSVDSLNLWLYAIQAFPLIHSELQELAVGIRSPTLVAAFIFHLLSASQAEDSLDLESEFFF